MSDQNIEPFQARLNAAVRAAERRIDDLRAAHAADPERWLAVRLDRYDDGSTTVVLFKPDSLHVEELVVAGGEIAAGPGLVALLLRSHADELSLLADGVSLTLPLTDA
jgi:hypothetical protein